jgi:hypothetical protein
VAKELSQFDVRQYVVLRDDFGRRWESTVDTIAKSTCAPINPKGWVDPLNTPQAVLVRALTQDEDGRLSLGLKEQYAAWRDELKQKAIAYEQTLFNDAMMLFGQEGPKAYEERSPGLMNYTGEGPQAWEPIEAALQGNSAALGKKPLESDPRIAKYFVRRTAPTLSFKDEDLMDIEEEHDPDALGGKRVAVGKSKKKEPVAAE